MEIIQRDKTNWFLSTNIESGFTTVYVTVSVQSPLCEMGEVASLLSELHAFLRSRDIAVFSEKLYGSVEHKVDICWCMEESLKRHFEECKEIPFTFVSGAPCVGGLLAGIQIVGVIATSSDTKLETVFWQNRAIGRSLETSESRQVHFAGVTGLAKGEEAPIDSVAASLSQTRRMYRATDDFLRLLGMSWQNVVRTWIYMPNILRWYGAFNRVRRECFTDFGLQGGDGSDYPASTGIQGRRDAHEEIFMDVLCVQSKIPGKQLVSPMRNTRQNEAREYGSLFSRGKAVQLGARPALYVSGTASIDPSGKTIYLQDPQGQVVETLLNVSSILETQKARLSDVVQGCAYCKDEPTFQVYSNAVRLLGLEPLPFIALFADVCRDNLLFEIDAVAIRNSEETV